MVMDSKPNYVCRVLFLSMLLMSFALPTPAEDLGIAHRKPVLGAACKTCPWGALAEIVKEMLAPYDYDVRICYNCSRSDAPRIVSEARMPSVCCGVSTGPFPPWQERGMRFTAGTIRLTISPTMWPAPCTNIRIYSSGRTSIFLTMFIRCHRPVPLGFRTNDDP